MLIGMDLMQFHKMRRAIQGNAFPGSEADLETVGGTLRDLLMASGLFAGVEVENTENPDELVIAMCRFRPEVSEQDVARHLESMWDNRVRYPFWEAHAFRVANGHVEFEAATRHSNGGHYVTVHLIAQKAIPAQRTPQD
jgi:hypothetical protein